MIYKEITEEDKRIGRKMNLTNAWILRGWDGVSFPVASSCFGDTWYKDNYGDQWRKYLILFFGEYDGFSCSVVAINHEWFPNVKENSFLIRLD